MDFKNSLLNYFEKTEIPAALDPDKVFSFVKPRAVEKKAVETSAAPLQPPKAVWNEPKEENIQPKTEEAQENSIQDVGASAFIKVVFYHKLTRNEFLTVLGNTKISNQAFQEIKDNPGLTVKGLIDILEDSSLTAEDYKKLIIAAERTAKLKEETREKLQSEEPKRSAENASSLPSSPIVPPASSKPKLNLNQLTSPKTQEMPPIKEHEPDRSRTNEFSLGGADPKASPSENTVNSSAPSEEKEENKEKSKRKLLFGRRKDEDFDEDEEEIEPLNDDDDFEEEEKKKRKKRGKRKKDIEEEDDDEDFDKDDGEELDDDYGDEHRSNKGKFVAAAIGAVFLIGISFGLRYYFTGSILPTAASDNPANEDIDLSEERIFDLISSKPAAQLSGYSQNPDYTVGGIREESSLKQVIAAEKRLVYISGNSLYVFEQIGGQTAQLDVRNYSSDIKLLGLAETEKGIAVISESEGGPYSFIRTENSSEETGDQASPPQTVNDTVTRPETVIELLDKENPEKRAGIVKYRLSGSLTDIFTDSGALIVLTEENIPQNASKEDFVTFMPFVLTSEGRKLCSAGNSVISNNSANSMVTAVFALTFDKETAMACAAGNPVNAAALNNGYLYLGTGNRLVKLAVNEGLAEKCRYTVDGSFEEFSAIGVDSTGGEQRVRATFKGDQGASVAVLDGELGLVGEVKGLGSGEAAAATCFYKDQTYLVTESGTCFGVDGNNQVITESNVKITGSNIYPLSAGGNSSNSIGIKVTPVDEGGKRTGLTVSTVKLDGTETSLNSTSISSKTVAKNALDEYLSSPAESGSFAIGLKSSGDGAGGIAVVPAVYFDGVSEVELFVIYSVSAEGTLSVNGTIAHYDSYSKNIFSVVKGDYVIAVTDNRIITAKAENGSVTSYFEVAAGDEVYNY